MKMGLFNFHLEMRKENIVKKILAETNKCELTVNANLF